MNEVKKEKVKVPFTFIIDIVTPDEVRVAYSMRIENRLESIEEQNQQSISIMGLALRYKIEDAIENIQAMDDKTLLNYVDKGYLKRKKDHEKKVTDEQSPSDKEPGTNQ